MMYQLWPRRFALVLFVAAISWSAISVKASEPKDDVAALMAEWAKAFSEHNVERVIALYSKDAVLWGTTAFSLRTTPDEVREYFTTAFKIPNIAVDYNNQTIRIFGNTAVVAGNYTFTARRDFHSQDSAARYSFTLIREGDRWVIVDHNSSLMPGSRAPSRRT